MSMVSEVQDTKKDGSSHSPSECSDLVHEIPPQDPLDFEPEPGVCASTTKPGYSVEDVGDDEKEAIVVPRSLRRGLFAHLSILAEVEEPKDYARKVKWFITFQVALAGAAAPMGSSIILPALSDIAIVFHSTETITNLSVALYMLSMSFFPLFWSSFSELYGRRTIYLVSFLLFVIFNVISAVSQNIAMFIVMRMLSGGASASVQAVGAGTIADVWRVKERGNAMSIFYLGPLCGPLLAPIIGGALAQGLGWRSNLWFMVIYGALLWILLVFFLPETLKGPQPSSTEVMESATGEKENPDTLTRVSTRQSVKIKSKKYGKLLKRCFVDPLAIVLNLRNPLVAMTVYYASIVFGSLYVLNISVQKTFQAEPYHFSTVIIGLMYIPNSLGYFMSSILGGKWIDSIMAREARKAGRYDAHGKLVYRPEDRMRENAWIGAVMFPLSLIWYGWSAEKGVLWICPAIANFFFGVGSMLIFAIVTTMLTEFMPHASSHGIALNNFVRNILACVGSVVAEPWINAIGNGWVFTILGLWCLFWGPIVIWAMKHFSDRLAAKAERKASAASR